MEGKIIFNSKYKEYSKWDSWKCSDFRVIDNLYNNIPKNKFIKEVLILAPKPDSGDRVDIYI